MTIDLGKIKPPKIDPFQGPSPKIAFGGSAMIAIPQTDGSVVIKHTSPGVSGQVVLPPLTGAEFKVCDTTAQPIGGAFPGDTGRPFDHDGIDMK